MDTLISTGLNDRTVYKESRVLDIDGNQVLYRPCPAADKKYANSSAGYAGEMPLFFGNTTNSFGRVLRRYVDKIFALGVDGVYHDEYGYSIVSYTYGTWDNRTAFFHPEDLSIRALPGALGLLTLELELDYRQIISANGGWFSANGQYPSPTGSHVPPPLPLC
jgi:hypothetical protein